MTETKRNVRLGGLLDLLVIIAVLVVVKQSVLPISMFYAGPASTLSAMIVGTYLLRRRGYKWGDLGLKWPKSWVRTIGLTFLVFGTLVLSASMFQSIAGLLFERVGTSGRFDHVEGNLGAYTLAMLVVWTHTAVFEEALFRAFIISKLSLFLGQGLVADLISVVLAAIFFGYRHYYYQGMYGALVTGGIGLVFGLFYIWFGRQNLFPLMLSHGIVNSISFTMRFLGIEPD